MVKKRVKEYFFLPAMLLCTSKRSSRFGIRRQEVDGKRGRSLLKELKWHVVAFGCSGITGGNGLLKLEQSTQAKV